MADPGAPEPRTFWHPLIVLVLERFLPEGWRLVPELLLGRMPQRVDIVVVRLDDKPAGVPRKLHSIFDHLRPHTLIEHKGPTDDLEPADVLTLLGYAAQYMVQNQLEDPGELCLMVVADRIPPGFVRQVERLGGRFEPQGGGLWHGELARLTLHGVELRTAYGTAPSERLLYAFSRPFLKDPLLNLGLDEEEEKVYIALYEQVEQLRKARGAMATKNSESAEESFVQAVMRMLKNTSPERRAYFINEGILAGMTPQERLATLTPQERLATLTPQERLAGLDTDQILSALSPEAREALQKKLSH